METGTSSSNQQPTIRQILNNTSLWVGHLQTDPTEHFAGQTFRCPSYGELNNIQIYTAAVQDPGEMVLSLHSFDSANKTWGPQLVSARVDIQRHDQEKWIRFDLPAVPLHADQTYGFRVRANNAMIAIGEAASGTHSPFAGEEWHADSDHEKGHYYRYFSLAFKVEMCA